MCFYASLLMLVLMALTTDAFPTEENPMKEEDATKDKTTLPFALVMGCGVLFVTVCFCKGLICKSRKNPEHKPLLNTEPPVNKGKGTNFLYCVLCFFRGNPLPAQDTNEEKYNSINTSNFQKISDV